ncbi:SMI1/KNR4 family protein [Listeria booriae]|uniref:SMI1/KNR4 family protein n=1 Tax=Listeria booriae TaxID=1552123 RepID=UPI00162AF684|nr:SMI1/KNR4 family protein [Listeria booriae]MBC1502529.1 SMI1/KNR4 family protein [Listeria booriae]MBC1512840.1 SMI1/KNR4 family protein [Listeria booriae]MBC1528782.1 SMI1/KNR4 family protein [Listeria booriae]MBC6134417.1 SMI1/KNR4 family protein [Listeria booriae]MBC6151807.1 SMI1/KNR4 family protein [Listeria booriae]
MSIESYNKAKEIIEENEELVDDFGEMQESLIIKAQKELGVDFPDEYKYFLTDFGALTFGSIEIYGVFKEDFENSGVPDAVWATLNERKLVNMPQYLVVIYNTGMGELLCLNFRDLNDNQEPKVTSYFAGFDESAQKHEVLYESFGDFILDMVKEEIL